jgi:DNA-binding NarL/FixJ family response regulator
MASISFPTTAGNMPNRTQVDSAAKTTAVQSEQPTKTTATADTKDTVEISTAAQAKLLHQQGQSVKSIASALGTDTKTVDDYLGIATTEALTAALKSAESAATSKG